MKKFLNRLYTLIKKKKPEVKVIRFIPKKIELIEKAYELKSKVRKATNKVYEGNYKDFNKLFHERREFSHAERAHYTKTPKQAKSVIESEEVIIPEYMFDDSEIEYKFFKKSAYSCRFYNNSNQFLGISDFVFSKEEKIKNEMYKMMEKLEYFKLEGVLCLILEKDNPSDLENPIETTVYFQTDYPISFFSPNEIEHFDLQILICLKID